MSVSESSQDKKYRLSLSGEFLVAGELLRRGTHAAVTYGNAKKADVIAICGDRALRIEVKTTQNPSWIVGQRAPEPSDQIWVFVYLPTDERAPEYYVLTAHELHAILAPIQEDYFRRYEAKHNKPYGNQSGVCTLRRSLLKAAHRGAWGKVTAAPTPTN